MEVINNICRPNSVCTRFENKTNLPCKNRIRCICKVFPIGSESYHSIQIEKMLISDWNNIEVIGQFLIKAFYCSPIVGVYVVFILIGITIFNIYLKICSMGYKKYFSKVWSIFDRWRIHNNIYLCLT